MAVTAGRLEWDLDVNKVDEALRKVDNLGRRMDDALNKNRSGQTGLDRVGRDAGQAESRVKELAFRFNELTAKLRLNLIDTRQYAAGLKVLEGDLRKVGQASGVTGAEYRQLATLTTQVQRAHATLGGSTASVVARVRGLVNEARELRNEWQRTGQATETTKSRLNALQMEMHELAEELRRADGGWQRFNQQITQLAVGGRMAEATVAGIEGRMSRLGLASQANLAAQQALVAQMYRFGPAGQAMAGTLGIVGGGMQAVSLSTLGVGGALVAAGLAANALTKKGIPEVQAMQAALNILVASGEELELLELQDTLRELQDAAAEAGNQFRRSEIATALAEIVKAGVDLKAATDLMVPGMQLAVLTGQSLNETTTLLLGNLRQFHLDTSEAARVADALAAADLRAAHSVRELSEGLAVVGPVAAAAGLSIEDTLGLLIELDNKGMDPATIGATGLRAALSALLDPTKEARDTLDSLGVKLRDGEGRARPLKDVLFELAEAFKGSEEAAQAAATIFDTRALTAILNVTNASREHADALRDSEGALRDYAAQVTREDVAKAQERLANAWADLASTFATGFADDLVFVLDKLAAFLEYFDRFLRAHQEAPWWAKGSAWRELNAITGGRLFSLDAPPPPEPAPAPSGWRTGGTMSDMDGDGRPDAPGAVEESIDALIAKARELKTALDAATTPQAWIAAQQRVDAFVASSEQAAEAWRAVTAIMSRGGRVSPAARPERTVEDVFGDLAAAGTDAERRATAFGNTLDATLESAQTRANLVGRALTELIEDFDLDPTSDKVQFLVGRLQALTVEVTRLKREINTPVTFSDMGGAFLTDVGLAGAPTRRPESEAELLQMLKDSDRNLADEVDRSIARQAGLLANRHALVRSIVETQDLRREVFALGIDVTEALQDGTLEGLQSLEATIVKRLEDLGDDASAAPLMGLLVKIREAIANAEAEAAEAARQAALTAARQALVQARVARSAFRVEARNLGRDVGDAIAAGNLEALRALEENLVTLLEELGDDPSAAPLMGLLTAVRSEIRNIEADARSARLALDRLLLNTRTVQTRVARSLELRDLGKQITAAIQTGSLEALEELEAAIVARLQEMGDDPAAAPFLGLLTRVRTGILDVKAALDSFSRGPSAVAPGGRWIFGAEVTGETLETADAIRTLQARIQHLRRLGLDPASEAVQELVRQINELQLKAALDELREGGFKNLSDFARKVLELNGIVPKATDDVETFADKLGALGGATGNDIAAGLAKIVDGITQIAEAGGDAEEIVKGLTLALQGAAQVVQAAREGDTLSLVRGGIGILGEGIGAATGIPGLGALATAAFDLGHQIVLGISDAFTGDSPAARAIRESLTPAVAGAFATGIMNALRGQEDWREALEGNVKEAFLGALIQAFVQSAIIDAVLAPIILQFSKLIAAGQYEEARAFLANELPAALNTAMTAIDVFLAGVPAGLLPGGGGDSRGPTTPPPSTPGIHSLPTASVMAAPAWAGELSGAARNFNLAAHKFDEAVDRLVNEGVRVRQTNTSSGGSAAAARAA